MKRFQSYLDAVGLDASVQPPKLIYTYAAYKNGTVEIFPTKELALKASKNIEAIVDQESKAAYDLYWKTRQSLEADAIALWGTDLSKEYSHLSDTVFDLCYDEAFDRSHSAGYDEVAGTMDDVVDFAENIMKAMK